MKQTHEKKSAARRRPQINVIKRARRAQGEFAKLTQKRWAEADRLKKFRVKKLASQIEYEIGRGQTHCALYENELQRLWPLDAKDRETRITQFAKEYGFRLRFYKKGLCAIFDRWPRHSA